MKLLQIKWQYLRNSAGETCGRCGGTYQSVINSIEKLRAVLKPVDIEPVLEIKEIDSETFKEDPAQSNRIWIMEKPLEEWLGAQVSSSCCDTVCYNSDCRTLQFEGQIFEAVPENLIVKAGMIAAAQLIEPY